jgi:hypothetical protein
VREIDDGADIVFDGLLHRFPLGGHGPRYHEPEDPHKHGRLGGRGE